MSYISLLDPIAKQPRRLQASCSRESNPTRPNRRKGDKMCAYGAHSRPVRPKRSLRRVSKTLSLDVNHTGIKTFGTISGHALRFDDPFVRQDKAVNDLLPMPAHTDDKVPRKPLPCFLAHHSHSFIYPSLSSPPSSPNQTSTIRC